jgi:DNA-binding response OmpR family regulator
LPLNKEILITLKLLRRRKYSVTNDQHLIIFYHVRITIYLMTKGISVRVLILDDEQDLMELCKDAFEMYGHESEGFTNPHDALEYLSKETAIDAIISDSKMPEMQGEEFFNRAKAKLGNKMPPFFLATGALEFTSSSVEGLGMTGLISKPFDIDELVGQVTEGVKKSA